MSIELLTPQEFIDKYTEELKQHLNVYNIQLNKTGFIGFLMNMLGWTTYDLKIYYDSLFKESTPVLAEKTNNLYLHSSTYGYIPSLAKPATLEGTINFDYSLFPAEPQNIKKRVITINNPNIPLEFKIDDYIFTSKSTYSVVIENNTRYLIIVKENGDIVQLPISSTSNDISIPLMDCYEYSTYSLEFVSESYPLYSFFQFPIDIQSGQIADITVFVNDEEYKVDFVKFLYKAFDNVVFIRQISPNKIILELGNGINGKRIPNSKVKVDIKTTNGEKANGIITNDKIPILNPIQIVITDTLTDGSVINSTLESKKYTYVSIDHVYNGEDILEGERLREELIKYIQTRDNLVSETDYYNIASKYFNDFKFLFKKINIVDNTFYLCRVLRDKYQRVLRSLIHSVDESSFGNKVFRPEFEIFGTTFISPFYYVWDNTLNWYNSYLIYSNYVTGFSEYKLIDTTDSNYIIPKIKLNITYDNVNDKTIFKLTSFDDLSIYTTKLTIYSLSIFNSDMTYNPTDNYFYYEYDGIVSDPLEVQVDFYEASDTTHKFYAKAKDVQYVFDTTDILKLVKFNNKVINIPVIEKSEFDSDPDFYIDKLRDFMIGNSFKENRMVSDELKYIFLNSYVVESPYIENQIEDGEKVFTGLSIKDVITSPPLNPSVGDVYYIARNPEGIFRGHTNELAYYNGSSWEFYNQQLSFFDDVLDELQDPPATPDDGDRYLILPSATGDWLGHDNEIAQYNATSSSWIFSNPFYNSAVHITNKNIIKYYDIDNSWKTIKLTLPLKLKLRITIDNNIVTKDKINILTEKDNILLDLMELLQKVYSSCSLKLYTDELVEYIMRGKAYMKSVGVYIFDNDNRLIFNNIVMKEDINDILSGLSKDQVVNYSPAYFHWDVDNIDIVFINK